MALSNKAIFECRPATGSDLNSGGYVTGGGGTDYTQQASPQTTFNGTSVTATTVGASATITITGYTVAAGDVGNLLRIASGTNYTAGLYQITSVNTGANTWTLDRNVSTGNGSALVGRMGGALATLVQFYADQDANTNVLGGYLCYMVGTLTITSAIAITGAYNVNVAGGNTASTLGGVQVVGYSSTRGDNGKATITTATNSVDLLHPSSNTRNISFLNIAFTTSAGTVGYGCTPSTASGSPNKIAFINCSWNGFKRAIWTDGPNNAGQITGLYLYNCTVTACTTDAIVNNCATFLHACYIYTNTGDGVRMESAFGNCRSPLVLTHCIFYNNTGKNVYQNQAGASNTDGDQLNIFLNCAFVGAGGDGVQFNVSGNNGLWTALIQNCIFYGNGGFGLNGNTIYGFVMGGNNAFASNTSGAYGGSMAALPGDVTLSGDPFNGRTSNDFSLNNTGGAGAACRQTGFPGILQNGGTGFADIGPLSPQASGGTTIFAVECNTSLIFNRGSVGGY